MSFADTLYGAARPFPIEENPFVARVCSGEATLDEVRSFALHMSSATESFVRALHSILGVCREPRVRHSLIGNVLEEEGATSYVPGSGASFDPARHHPTMARRFARAAGVTDEELNALEIGPPRWFVHALRAGNWLGPFAYIAVGTESNIPPTYRLLIPAFAKHYGFQEHDLEFLTEHVTVDDRHGLEGAMLIASIARDDAARAQALEGARRGGRGWWEILRRHVRAPHARLVAV